MCLVTAPVNQPQKEKRRRPCHKKKKKKEKKGKEASCLHCPVDLKGTTEGRGTGL